MLTLQEVAQELSRRLSSIFLPDENGERPCHGETKKYSADPHWRDLVLFHEYFHGETGRGLGASHQTGWTPLAARLLENAVENRIESNTRRKLTAATHPAYAPRLAQNVSHVQAAQRLRFEVFASIQRRHNWLTPFQSRLLPATMLPTSCRRSMLTYNNTRLL
jgi:hypothetical protein